MAINIISDAALVAYLDSLTQVYLKIRGADPTGTGSPTNASEYGLGIDDGDWGAFAKVEAVVEAVVLAADVGPEGIDPIVALGLAAQNLRSRVSTKVVAASLLTEPMTALNSHISQAAVEGTSTIDAFLAFRNTGEAEKWKALMPPAFGLLFYDLYSVSASVYNLWFEVLQGSVYTNALGKKVVGGAYTDGQLIDTDIYCGGFPKIKVVGVVGTGVITVTGSAYNPATKAVVTGRTWVYDLNVAADGTYTLAPGGATAAAADSLIVGIDSISAAAGITAGTIYAEAHRPSGRDAFAY